MTDQDLREMLHRRAADATPSPDAWERIVERIEAGESAPVVDLSERRRRRFGTPTILGAIAAAALVLFGAVALLSGGEDRRVQVADDGSSAPDGRDGTTSPDTAVPTGVAAGRLPLWPATTLDGLAPFQDDAAAGRRPDLVDPRAVAAGYLSERFADPTRIDELVQDFAVGAFEETAPGVGEVAFESPPGTPAGTVVVRRLEAGAGDGLWFVAGLSSTRISVTEASYDGDRFRARALVAGAGDLTTVVGPTDGDVATGEMTRAVTEDELGAGVAVDQRITGTTAVVLELRLVEPSGRVSLAVLRVEGPEPDLTGVTSSCDSVGFTPNSEDLASSVKVTGASCEEAERFLAVAGPETSAVGPQQVEVDGYRCVRTASTEDPLPVSSYRCTKGDVTVTFDRS